MARVVNVSMVLIIMLIIMVAAAIFVYRDAKKRGMNAVVWALVAFFGPFLVGVIIYIICRTPLTDLRCSKCGAGLTESANECPECKSPVLTECPQCQFPVQKGWKSCPKCGGELLDDYTQPIRTYKKESGMGPIIALVVVLVIVLLLGVAAITGVRVFYSSSVSYGGSEGLYNISEEDMKENEAITKWISKSNDSKKNIHVLLSKKSDTCLIYVKNNDNLMTIDSEITFYDEDTEAVFYIEESEYEDKYGYHFFMYEFEVYDDMKITTFYGNDEVDVEVTYTDSDISMDTWREN